MKKAAITMIMTVTLVAFMTIGWATPVKTAGDNTTPQSELKVVGSLNNQPVFQLNLQLPYADGFTVTIRDEFGNLLFKEFSTSATYTKKFLFNEEELGDTKLRFEIYGRKNDKVIVYEVNRSERTVEDTVITRL